MFFVCSWAHYRQSCDCPRQGDGCMVFVFQGLHEVLFGSFHYSSHTPLVTREKQECGPDPELRHAFILSQHITLSNTHLSHVHKYTHTCKNTDTHIPNTNYVCAAENINIFSQYKLILLSVRQMYGWTDKQTLSLVLHSYLVGLDCPPGLSINLVQGHTHHLLYATLATLLWKIKSAWKHNSHWKPCRRRCSGTYLISKWFFIN